MPRAVYLVKPDHTPLLQHSSPVWTHRRHVVYLRPSTVGSCSGPTFANRLCYCLLHPDRARYPLVRQARPAGLPSPSHPQQSHRKIPRAGPGAPRRSCLYRTGGGGHGRLRVVVRPRNMWVGGRQSRSGSRCETVHPAAGWPWRPNVVMGVCLRRARVLYHFMYGSPLCRLRCNVWARRGGIRSTEVLRSFVVSRPGNSRSHSLAGVSELGLYGLRAMCRDRVYIVEKRTSTFHRRWQCSRICLQGFAACLSSKDGGTDLCAEAVPTPILDNLLQPRPWGLDISTNNVDFL